MVRMVVVIILSCLFFSFGETGNSNSNKITYLGRWVGDPTKLLEKLDFAVVSMGLYSRFCVYGNPDGSEFVDKAFDCLEVFTKNAKSKCDGLKNVSYYAIANLRMAHSNVITSMKTYNKYGHFVIVYGDVLCLMRIKQGK